jgi:uncharacterized protein
VKRDLTEILACPVCKGDLNLEITEEKAREIWSGTLTCSACRQRYPVEEGIPNLLPPKLEAKA